MRILLIVDVVDNGGVCVVLRNLLYNIDTSKYEIDILSFEENKKYESQLPDSVKIRNVYKKNPIKHKNKYIRYIYSLLREICPKWIIRRFIVKKKYDLAIDFKGNNLNVLTALKCRKLFWSHKDFSPITNPIEKRVIEEYSKTRSGAVKEKLFLKNLCKADGVICISEACKKAFVERWNYPEERTHVLMNVLDVEEIQSKSIEKITYSKTDKFTFCCMSRISSGKGIERLLNCVRTLNGMGYSFVLNIVGGGDTLNEMISLAKSMNVDNVVFFGNQDNPYPYVVESDVFVCPSETEAYGTAVCEALILGKPIITTKTASVPEIFGNSEYGLVVENCEQEILAGMKRFLDEPELVDFYHKQAVKRLEYFDVQFRVNAVEEYIDEIAKNI